MILFSDFDDTFFFRNDEKKTNDNFEAVKKWRSGHRQFCIATGRSYKSMIEYFPAIKEICDYYIVDGGSVILSRTAELVKAFYFDPAIIDKIIEFSKKFPEIPAVYYYTPISEDTNYKTENVTKLRLWFKDTSLLEYVTEEIKKAFPVFALELDVAGILKHKDLIDGRNGFVEIFPIGFGKSDAIKFLQQEKNISSKDIITIGDDFNDYEMIRDFNGFAIADSKLANTYQELKTIDSIKSLVIQNIAIDAI